jgi:hypothetical protein
MAALTNAEIESTLKKISDTCTNQHGFDPGSALGTDELKLAAGEKEWRKCVYAEIRTELMPRSSVPEQYEKIIAQDIRFTQAIEAGEMTRTERSQRNRANRQIVETNEKIAQVGSDAQRNEDRERFIKGQMDAVLRFQRTPAIMR